jgi:hypothetical protein
LFPTSPASRSTCVGRDISRIRRREDLTAIDMNLVDVGTVTRASELIKQQFNQRYDLEFSFNRKIVRVYDVPRFSGADIHLFDDTSFDETVPVPPPQPNT